MARKFSSDLIQSFGENISKKMDDVENAIREEGNRTQKNFEEVNEKFDRQEEINNAILDDMSARERKELYNMNSISDVTDLEETERQLLVDILFTIANNFETVNETQQRFNRAVKNLLGIRGVDTDLDLSCVDNIDSNKDRKIILQTVMEFLFLKTCDFAFMDSGTYDELFENFNVKDADIAKIGNNISAVYKAVGTEGFVDKYDKANYEDNNSYDEDEYNNEEYDYSENYEEDTDWTPEPSREEKIKNIVTKYIDVISNGQGWYTWKAVEDSEYAQVFQNVRSYIAPGISSDEICGYIDTTVFGKGKSGLLFTTEYLYHKDSSGLSIKIPYYAIDAYQNKKDTLLRNSIQYAKGFLKVDDYRLDGMYFNAPALMDCLNEIIALF